MKQIEILELRIAKFLRYGVLIAGLFMLIGLIASFRPTQNPFTELAVYKPEPLLGVLTQARAQNDWKVLLSYLGLFLLISLPMLRVFLTGVLFIHKKEYGMGLISILVLIGLLVSFSLGI